jgi:hypothetical protein
MDDRGKRRFRVALFAVSLLTAGAAPLAPAAAEERAAQPALTRRVQDRPVATRYLWDSHFDAGG